MICDVCRRRKGRVMLVLDNEQSIMLCKRCLSFYKKVKNAKEIKEKAMGKEKLLSDILEYERKRDEDEEEEALRAEYKAMLVEQGLKQALLEREAEDITF